MIPLAFFLCAKRCRCFYRKLDPKETVKNGLSLEISLADLTESFFKRLQKEMGWMILYFMQKLIEMLSALKK